MANEERCVMCNDQIPEGRQVCPVCTNKVMNNEVLTMNNNENNVQATNTNIDPVDKVVLSVKGVFTKFHKTKGPKNTVDDCRILASVSEGIVSISMAQEKGVMLTVRLDEMVELVSQALEKAREVVEEIVDEGGNENG